MRSTTTQRAPKHATPRPAHTYFTAFWNNLSDDTAQGFCFFSWAAPHRARIVSIHTSIPSHQPYFHNVGPRVLQHATAPDRQTMRPRFKTQNSTIVQHSTVKKKLQQYTTRMMIAHQLATGGRPGPQLLREPPAPLYFESRCTPLASGRPNSLLCLAALPLFPIPVTYHYHRRRTPPLPVSVGTKRTTYH